MTGARVVKLLIPFVVSGLALALVFALADLSALAELHQRMRWDMLPWAVLTLFAILLALSWRWYLLLRARLPVRRLLIVVALGLGGNQVLPFRGGDALRVVLSARGNPRASMHTSLSALAMEKVLDLMAVAALGLASAATLLGGSSGSGTGAPYMALVAAVLLVPATAVLLAAASGVLGRWIRASARLVRLPARYYAHAVRPMHHFRHLASPRSILMLLLQTAAIWLVLYVLTCIAIAALVGVEVTFAEAMVLLFAVALGLAVPAAPSGLGTLHAAVVSAFLLLNRSAAEGLLVGVALHAAFFFWFSLSGVVALAAAGRGFIRTNYRGEGA